MTEQKVAVNITITHTIDTMYKQLALTTDFTYDELLSGALEYALEDIAFISYMLEKNLPTL